MRMLLVMFLAAKMRQARALAATTDSFRYALWFAFQYACYARAFETLSRLNRNGREMHRYKIAKKADVAAILETYGMRIPVSEITHNGITLPTGARIYRTANGAVPCWHLVGYAFDSSDIETVFTAIPKSVSLVAL